jgi:hypothetical protein
MATLKFLGISSVSLKTEVVSGLLLMVLLLPLAASHASAQSIPLPPPSPSNSGENTKIAPNDRVPPNIQILTTELDEGKNVFRVKITDDSSLQVREIKFVQNGQLTSTGLFRDQNDVYKALIDIHSPSRVVEVTASDANGNVASTFREYDVKSTPNMLTQILNALSQIPHTIQNLLGW